MTVDGSTRGVGTICKLVGVLVGMCTGASRNVEGECVELLVDSLRTATRELQLSALEQPHANVTRHDILVARAKEASKALDLIVNAPLVLKDVRFSKNHIGRWSIVL
jgi:hypothetical protein